MSPEDSYRVLREARRGFHPREGRDLMELPIGLHGVPDLRLGLEDLIHPEHTVFLAPSRLFAQLRTRLTSSSHWVSPTMEEAFLLQ